MNPAVLTSTSSGLDLREPIGRPSGAEWSRALPVASRWQAFTLKEVLQAAQLPENWDTYSSPPPSRWVVDTAIRLVTGIDADDLPVPHVVPVPGGGIQLEWSVGDREVEIAVLPEGSIEFLRTTAGEAAEEGVVTSYGQLYSLLGWVAER